MEGRECLGLGSFLAISLLEKLVPRLLEVRDRVIAALAAPATPLVKHYPLESTDAFARRRT